LRGGFLDIVSSFLLNPAELAYEHGVAAKAQAPDEETLAMARESGKQYPLATIF
jgi:hypothetical protein